MIRGASKEMPFLKVQASAGSRFNELILLISIIFVHLIICIFLYSLPLNKTNFGNLKKVTILSGKIAAKITLIPYSSTMFKFKS